MVNHASDAPNSPPPPDKDLADQILEKVDNHLLEGAYGLMKTSLNLQFKGSDEDGDGIADARSRGTDIPMTAEEKKQTVEKLVAELESKQPGVMEKLSGAWLLDFYNASMVGKQGAKVLDKKEVIEEAKFGTAFSKAFAGAALKDLNNVANLNNWSSDGNHIDAHEAAWNVYRKQATAQRTMGENLCGQGH